MRWVIGALVGLALTPSAYAGDYDILRGAQPVGPATFTRWSGFYLGGQYSYSDATTNFGRGTQPLVAFSLRELALEEDDAVSQWPILGKSSTFAQGFGGFAGYNTQWQDLILGLEANYSHTSFDALAPVLPIGRQVTAGSYLYNVNLTATGDLHITDFGSLRARAGWVFGNLLPYGFAGLALGRGNYSITTLVYGQQNPSTPAVVPCNTTLAPSCIDFSYSNSAAKNDALLYGFTVGGGLDFALTSNIFVRAEYEYVQFAPVTGIAASISSARVGAGLKF